MAGDNLRIAQHRDKLRYAKLRSGAYTPQLRRYLAGDYVWVRKQHKAGLDIAAKQLILRVQEVRASGVLILQGRCGTLRAVHVSQCAPCHLPDIDPQIDWSLGKPPPAAVCEQCGEDDSEQQGQLIFCDNCNNGWHLGCHRPTLSSQPPGTWVCQPCQDQGITREAVEALQQASDLQAQQQQQPEKLLPAALRSRALDGRLIKKLFTKPGQGGGTQWYWGRVSYRGSRPGGDLLIAYEDGDAEVTTWRRLQRQQVEWLPEGTILPRGVSIKMAAAAEADIAARVQPIRAGRGGKPQRGRGGVSKGQQLTQRHPASTALSSQPVSPALTAAATSYTGGEVPSGVPTHRSSTQLQLIVLSQDILQLPDSWDLTSSNGVHSALQLLMPGPLAKKDATRLSNICSTAYAHSRLPKHQQGPGLGYVGMTAGEVHPLLAAVDFSGCSSFFDPFSGSGTISQVFQAAGYTVTNNDLNPFWGAATAADALQPNCYLLPFQVLVTSPPFDLLDIAVPLLAAKAAVAACVHVPGHWLANPRAARQQWLSRMAAAGRVHIIMGLERGPSHKRCAWLLIFATTSLKQQLMLPGGPCVPVSYPAF